MRTMKYSHLVLLFSITLVARTMPSAAAPLLTVAPGNSSVQVGQNFVLDITIANVPDVYAFQFDLGFDPIILAVTSITEGAFLPSGGATTFVAGAIDNKSGNVTETADTLIGPISGVSGSGTLATVGFQALATGASAVTLTNVIFLDSSLAAIVPSTTTGSVTVESTPGSNVPEPSSLLLLATGLTVMVYFGRNQKKCRQVDTRRNNAVAVRS